MNESAATVSGFLVAADLVIALFFLRFRNQTGDRLFAFFAAAFALLALQRFLLVSFADDTRATILLYALRAFAFLIIIYAIIDKNRSNG